MKKLLFLLIGSAFLSAGAQTVEEVVQKYSDFHGGLDAFNKVKTAKITGTFSTQGMDLPVVTQIINGKAVKTEVEVMGSQVINVYNNGKGWKQNPFAGAPSPTEVTGAELEEIKAQSMLANPLMDYKARGNKVELAGQVDVEGVKTYKVILTDKTDGKTTTYYINASDYSLLKTESEREIQGEKVTIETWYSDLKSVNGLKFYSSRIQKAEGEEIASIKSDTIELNVAIDEKIFDMP